MTEIPNSPPAELPIWKGRRGLINAALCCVLALPCAFGLLKFAERRVIGPACTAYARDHGMTYRSFTTTGTASAPSSHVACVLTQADGSNGTAGLETLVPFLTNAWVLFAVDIAITIPAFAVLLGLLRVAWYKRTIRLNT